MAEPQIQGLPEGATVGQPVQQDTHIDGLPAGAVVGQPVQQDTPASPQSGQLAQDLKSATTLEKAPGEKVASDIISGIGEGAGDTITGVSKLLHKIPVIGEKLAPEAGIKAMETRTKPENTTQWVGYGGENLAEFLLGDEALKGLSLADKFSQISGVMKILEKSPRLMKALQMGADVGKAAGELGPEEQAAIKKSPLLARLVGHGMDAVRQGAVAGAQETAKTGDVKKGAEAAATTGVASGVLGSAFGVLGRAGEKAGEAGKAVQEASDLAKSAPTKEEMGKAIAANIQKADEAMHADFEKGITDLKDKLGDAKVAYKGSPLQRAATNTMESAADVPENKITTLGKEFKGLSGGSDTTKKLLEGLADPGKAGDLTIDELIQRRQQLGEKIGQLTGGNPSSADRADVAVYQKLRDGIDQTIEKMAKDSGSPEASQDYATLRNAYKGKVNLFKEPVIRAMQDGDLDNAGKYLLSGGKVLDKLNTLEQVVGPDATKQFGQHIAQNILKDATSESGKFNPAKFAKDWKKIDSLSPEVKQRLFDMSGAGDGLDQLSKNLKSAANYQKLARAGVLGAVPGALTHGWGLAFGLLSEAAPDKIGPMLDAVANRPGMWRAFEKAGEAGKKIGASSAPRLAQAVGGKGVNALRNVLQGASQPLSQDEQGVYTNQ